MNAKVTEELKNQIIKEYLKKPITLNELANKFNLTYPTIWKVLKNTPKYSKAKIKNPNLKEDYFENIDSDDKAYFLGLIISDGNVFTDNTGRQSSISITLDLGDEYMLNNFKNAVLTNTVVAKDGRGTGQIAVRSNVMAKDLAKYGVIPRKSFFTYLPEINEKFYGSLIRGIFDGDGSIEAKQTNKRNKFLHCISFCGTHKLMQDISDLIYTKLSLSFKPKVYDYKNRNLSEIKIQRFEDIKKLGLWMYGNSSLFLIRKRKLFDYFMKHYFGNDNTELTD